MVWNHVRKIILVHRGDIPCKKAIGHFRTGADICESRKSADQFLFCKLFFCDYCCSRISDCILICNLENVFITVFIANGIVSDAVDFNSSNCCTVAIMDANSNIAAVDSKQVWLFLFCAFHVFQMHSQHLIFFL